VDAFSEYTAGALTTLTTYDDDGQLERRNVYDGAGQLDSSTDYGPDGAPDVERSDDSADRADVVTTYDVSNHLDTVQYLDDNLQLTHFQDYAPDGSYHETAFTGAGLIDYQASFDSSARLDLINWHDATGQFYQQERYDDLERLDYIQTREGGGWSYWTYDDNEQPDYVESFDERGVVTFRGYFDDSGRYDTAIWYDDYGRKDAQYTFDDFDRIDTETIGTISGAPAPASPSSTSRTTISATASPWCDGRASVDRRPHHAEARPARQRSRRIADASARLIRLNVSSTHEPIRKP
jgi:hypothetical protein